jgi:Pyruvate/2-oxoacid:ferredoxin oxidoreductase gamma subunit
VLLGAVANHLTIDPAIWQQALQNMVPAKVLEVNYRAFELGRSI